MSHLVESGVAPDMEDDDIDMELDDVEPDPVSSLDHATRAHGREEAEWLNQELEVQLKDVMQLLKKGLRKWDNDHGPPDALPLEPYKKTTVVTKKNPEVSRPTALHILAWQYKTDYADIPDDIIRPVIRDLLLHGGESLAGAKPDEKRKEEPILKVAILIDIDEFVQHVKAAWPEGFPDLLDAQDSDGKNALHHIFAWSNDKVTTRPEAEAKLVLKRALDLIPAAKKETLAAQDADGNTPIHYATDYRRTSNPNSFFPFTRPRGPWLLVTPETPGVFVPRLPPMSGLGKN
jgi:hypothetical protein